MELFKAVSRMSLLFPTGIQTGGSRLSITGLVSLALFALSFSADVRAADLGQTASDTATDSIPSWRRGVSRWTGSGYASETPTASIEAASRQPNQVPQAPSSYTVPAGPEASIAGGAFTLPVLNGPAVGHDLDSQESPVGSAIEELPLPNPAVKPDAVQRPLADPVAESVDANPHVPEEPSQSPTSQSQPSTAKPSGSIGKQLDESVGVDVAAPLEEEVTRWYEYPRRWMKGWDSHAEFGIDGSDGNASTLAVQTGLELRRQSDRDTLAIDIDYRQATNRQRTIEDNGRFNVDYDRLLSESSWAGFGKLGLEWDRFKAFDLRVNVNGGLAYHWIREDQASLVTRFGAGASQEIGAPNDAWIAEAVFGIDAQRQLTSRQKIKGKVDYFPAWEDFNNYRIVTDLAWEILLDGTDNLSLKLAVTDRYDSTPQGAKPNDIYYSMLLLYKF